MTTLYELPDYAPPILFSKVFFVFLLFLAVGLIGFAALIRILQKTVHEPALLNRPVRNLRVPIGILTVLAGVGVTALLVLMGSTYMERKQQYEAIVVAYQNGDYETVEGPVEDFSPRMLMEHGSETFTVDGVTFDCPTVREYGYDKTYGEGGVIRRNGQVVRIGYVTYKGEHVIVLIQEP